MATKSPLKAVGSAPESGALSTPIEDNSKQSDLQALFPQRIPVQLGNGEVGFVQPFTWEQLLECGIQLALYGVDFSALDLLNPAIAMQVLARYREGVSAMVALGLESTNIDGWERALPERLEAVKRMPPLAALEVLLLVIKQNMDFFSKGSELLNRHFPEEMAKRKATQEQAAAEALAALKETGEAVGRTSSAD